MGKYALFASYTDAGLGWNGFQATSDRVDDLKRLMTPDRGRFFNVATTSANADEEKLSVARSEYQKLSDRYLQEMEDFCNQWMVK